jgi:hypothetical protein
MIMLYKALLYAYRIQECRMVMWLSCVVFDSADEVAQLLHTQCKQYWFEELATSIILSTCTAHLLLVLLWGQDKKPGGSRNEYMQGQMGRAGQGSPDHQP